MGKIQKSSFRKIISTKKVNWINIDVQVNWKTCVLIGVTIFLTHLLNWCYWTWQHIRSHHFFGKRFLLIDLGLFLHKCFWWDWIFYFSKESPIKWILMRQFMVQKREKIYKYFYSKPMFRRILPFFSRVLKDRWREYNVILGQVSSLGSNHIL